MKEITYVLENGYTATDRTEDEVFATKAQSGWDMIGYHKVGKSRYTWCRLGANVVKITVNGKLFWECK